MEEKKITRLTLNERIKIETLIKEKRSKSYIAKTLQMEKEALSKILDELKEKSKDYQHQVELSVLDNCPFIVQVAAMTITTDENTKVISQNSNYPTQFTQKAVDEILTMTFKNGNGDVVIPKVFTRVNWYQERLNEITKTIKILETSFSEA